MKRYVIMFFAVALWIAGFLLSGVEGAEALEGEILTALSLNLECPLTEGASGHIFLNLLSKSNPGEHSPGPGHQPTPPPGPHPGEHSPGPGHQPTPPPGPHPGEHSPGSGHQPTPPPGPHPGEHSPGSEHHPE